MNKEQFYDELNGIINELTIEYVQQLRGNAEGMLEKLNNETLTSDEIVEYLKEQEDKFRENLESSIDDLYDQMLEMISNNNKLKEGLLDKLKSSFRRVYESILSKFKDLF
jgi:phosphomevalonate kinase